MNNNNKRTHDVMVGNLSEQRFTTEQQKELKKIKISELFYQTNAIQSIIEAKEPNESNEPLKQAILTIGGDDGKFDVKKGIELLEMSAGMKNSVAMTMLGVIYQLGIDPIERDIQKAVNYYQKASKMGNPDALNNIGWLYSRGVGVNRDVYKSIKYLKMSAKMGNTLAMNSLGYAYMCNTEGVGRDLYKSIHFYKMSAKRGNAYAMNNLGWIYEQGSVEVSKNIPLAIEYYKNSALLGSGGSKEGFDMLKELLMKMGQHESLLEFTYGILITDKQKLSMSSFIAKFNIIWKEQYHHIWPLIDAESTNKIVMTLLLISKHRRKFNRTTEGAMTDGVMTKNTAMIIIKYICNFGKRCEQILCLNK